MEIMPLYTLEVFIISGPVRQRFIKRNPVLARTIEIRDNQTLAELHQAIFKAFDREDEHMYEFQFGGQGPNDPQAKRYGLPMAVGEQGGGAEIGGDVTKTTLASLKLKAGAIFGYWFDFGDDWWHQIKVLSIEEKALTGKYPQVIERIGASPPQYIAEARPLQKQTN